MEFKSSLDLPSNSAKSKESTEQPKKLEPVAQGKKTKKSFGSKFSDAFIATDGGELKDYLVKDVLVPAAKDTLMDLIKSGFEMLLYGETRGGGRGASKSIPGSKVSYQKYYDNGKSAVKAAMTDKFSYDDIIFETRSQAQDCLDMMIEAISEYGSVSVADMYDLAGVDSNSFQDNKWGWKNLSQATVTRGRDGHYIKLPRVTAI